MRLDIPAFAMTRIRNQDWRLPFGDFRLAAIASVNGMLRNFVSLKQC